MAVQIITDSTSDLTEQEQRELNVHMLHMRVIFEDGVYTDGVDITKEQFYEKQAQAKILPKTTQVNPQEYCDAFEPLLENGDEVVAIIMSSRLSGTFQSAQIAKDMAKGGERLHLVDSLNVTIGEGLLVREAVRMRDAGATGAQIAAALEELKHRVRFVAFIGTLKYLKMGGRISTSTAVLGTMLGISPVVAIVDGEVKSVGQGRAGRRHRYPLRPRLLRRGLYRVEMRKQSHFGSAFRSCCIYDCIFPGFGVNEAWSFRRTIPERRSRSPVPAAPAPCRWA